MRKHWTPLFAALFLVLLLVSGCVWSRTPEPTASKSASGDLPTLTVKVYFVRMFNEREGELVEEQHSVPKASSMPLMALQELIRGQIKTSRTYAMVPVNTKIRSLKIDKDGLATVDFSREILGNRAISAAAETYGIASMVATLTQFPNIKRVKFQVEGKESGNIDGKSIDNWWGFGGIKKQPFKL